MGCRPAEPTGLLAAVAPFCLSHKLPPIVKLMPFTTPVPLLLLLPRCCLCHVAALLLRCSTAHRFLPGT